MSSIIRATTTSGLQVAPDNSGSLQLQTNGTTTAVTIDTSQNVGIGTTSPSTKLQLSSSQAAESITSTTAGQASYLLLNNTADSSNSYIYCPNKELRLSQADTSASSIVTMFTQNIERMRIDSSGNVGIGTSSPFAGIDLTKYSSAWTSGNYYSYPSGNAFIKAAAVSGQNNWIGITGSYGASTGSANLLLQANFNNVSQQAGNYIGSEATAATTADITFGKIVGGASTGVYGSKSEFMRIDSVGRPLFNTTSALNAGYMSLLFDGQTYNGFTLKTSYATTGSVYLYFINSAGNVAGFVSQNGTTTVSYTTSSDYRLKENIVPMTGALDKVLQLKPVNYTWKQDGTNGQGFIAHELQAIVPDAVVGEKDAVDEEGNPKYQGVDTSFLVATLTAAIQEQQTIINDLKARIETLEAK